MAKSYQELDAEILSWLLDNLPAGRATLFRRQAGRLECRARAGDMERSQSSSLLALVERVVGTGRSEVRPKLICVPLHGIHRDVVGAILIDLPLADEHFGDSEFRFVQRCTRWIELTRMGRARPDKPRLMAHDSDSTDGGQSTLASRSTVSSSQAEGSRPPKSMLKRPAIFFRSLYTMMNAGLPINEALYFLSESTDAPSSKVLIGLIADQVTNGAPLSKALAQHPGDFGRYLIGLIKVGESSGALAQVLLTISNYLEVSDKAASRLRSALVYPAILVTGALVLMVVAAPLMLRGQLEMLESSPTPLPLLTQVMIHWSNFCGSVLFPIALVSIGIIGTLLYQNARFRVALRRTAQSLPMLRKVSQLVSSARFARALSLSIRSGQNVLEAISNASQASSEPILIEACKTAGDRMLSGMTLSESLKDSDCFPKGFFEVLVAGEEIGDIPAMLDLLANLYELELEAALSQLLAVIEPILLLVVGIFTGLVLVCTLQPTLTLLQTL